MRMRWAIAYKTRLGNSVAIRILTLNNFILKHFITKVLEYIAGLKGKIKFVCVATYVFLSDESLLT